MSSPVWFNARKAAQLAAFFSNKEGEHINVLKLNKLIYLADRKHMECHGKPITGDRLLSMPHGPVNSLANNLIDGNISDDKWDEFVGDRDGYSVGANKEYEIAELDEFSPAEIETLSNVWQEFGAMGKYEIRDWTHKNCPEWENPHGSANPIPYERVLKFLGVEDPSERAEEIEDQVRIEKLFAQMAS